MLKLVVIFSLCFRLTKLMFTCFTSKLEKCKSARGSSRPTEIGPQVCAQTLLL